jgi:hypothetical protein
LRGRARPTVDQEQLELGTDGGRADAEARALQEPAQGQQALLEPYLEALVVDRVEAVPVDREAHSDPPSISGSARGRR